jgi:hypothetical protein
MSIMINNILLSLINKLSDDFINSNLSKNIDDFTAKMNYMVVITLSCANKINSFEDGDIPIQIIFDKLKYHPSSENVNALIKESMKFDFDFDNLASFEEFFFNVLNYEERLKFIESILAVTGKENKIKHEKQIVKMASYLKCKKNDFIILLNKNK